MTSRNKTVANALASNAMSAASVKPGMKVKKVRGNYANEVGTVKEVHDDSVLVDLPGYRVPIYWALDSIVAVNAVPNAEPEVDAAVKTALATKLKAVSRALRDSYQIVHGQSAGMAKSLIPAEFKALYDELIDPSYAQKIDALAKRLS